MFSQEIRQYAFQRCQEALRGIPSAMAGELSGQIAALSGDIKIAVEFLYGTLPFRDVTTVPFDLLRREAEQALLLWQEDHWNQRLLEDLFLHFVLTPRVNAENVEECRRFFHDQVFDRVKDLPLREAVLETNLWCCEQVTYQASSNRAESPLTAYRSGKGRCGEESTFVVTVLRSLGIPARQIYTPFWSHCDDNHAWVEVYVDGDWQFLGACEPEPVLNRGWFLSASSRAALIHTRTFSDFTGEGMKDEALVECRNGVYFYNETHRYAPTCSQKFAIRRGDGTPAAGAAVRLQVMNMASFSTVAILRADDAGLACVRCGMGSLHAEISAGAESAVLDFMAGETECIEVVLQPGRSTYQGDVDFHAPEANPLIRERPAEEQVHENRLKIRQAAEKRASRINGYYQSYCQEHPDLTQTQKKYLKEAKGNVREIGRFLLEQPAARAAWAEKLLGTLEEKDMRDSPAEVLNAHLEGVMRFLPQYQGREDAFAQGQLSPRIGWEVLRPWRQPLLASLTEEEQAAFAAQPELAAKAILEEPRDRVLTWYTIVGLSDGSRDSLFVALERAVGQCARLNPASGKAEYLTEAGWYLAFPEAPGLEQAWLTLEAIGSDWNCHANWSLSRWDGVRFQTQEYSGLFIKAGERCELKLEPGTYRLVTTNRLPNGNQLAHVRELRLENGEAQSCTLTLRQAKAEEMLEHNQLQDFKLTKEDGSVQSAKALCEKGHNTVFAFLQAGAEPTEHFLNEVRERKDALTGLELVLILRNWGEKQDPTLRRLLDAYPGVQLYTNPFEDDLSMMARGMFLDPDSLPVVVLADETYTGIYGHCGYTVGSVDMALKLARLVLDE